MCLCVSRCLCSCVHTCVCIGMQVAVGGPIPWWLLLRCPPACFLRQDLSATDGGGHRFGWPDRLASLRDLPDSTSQSWEYEGAPCPDLGCLFVFGCM